MDQRHFHNTLEYLQQNITWMNPQNQESAVSRQHTVMRPLMQKNQPNSRLEISNELGKKQKGFSTKTIATQQRVVAYEKSTEISVRPRTTSNLSLEATLFYIEHIAGDAFWKTKDKCEALQ